MGRRMFEDLEGLFLDAFYTLFNLVGSLLIIYGGIRATLGIIMIEALKKPYSYQQVRKELTNKISTSLKNLSSTFFHYSFTSDTVQLA
jgi:uncharacterized membrane protein